MRLFFAALFDAIFLLTSFSAKAELILVSQDDFGPNTKTEIFNEPIDWSNAAYHSDAKFFESLVRIGANEPYTFANTGITFLSPVPNIEQNWTSCVVLMSSLQYWGFGEYGELPGAGSPSVIPGGSGARFLVQYMSAQNIPQYILQFPGKGALRVGGNWILGATGISAQRNPSQDAIVVSAWGENDRYLGTIGLNPTTVENWANTFQGFAAVDGSPIIKIGIISSSNYGAHTPGVANLRFDPVSIPEPSMICLLAAASVCAGFTPRRKIC